jgi:hypothetical protein
MAAAPPPGLGDPHPLEHRSSLSAFVPVLPPPVLLVNDSGKAPNLLLDNPIPHKQLYRRRGEGGGFSV